MLRRGRHGPTLTKLKTKQTVTHIVIACDNPFLLPLALDHSNASTFILCPPCALLPHLPQWCGASTLHLFSSLDCDFLEVKGFALFMTWSHVAQAVLEFTI